MGNRTGEAQSSLSRARRGLLVVYTGNGKGKTTAALGMVFRALGRGFRVSVVQFRDAPPELLEAADLVSEMVSVKHPSDTGQMAQIGVDF